MRTCTTDSCTTASVMPTQNHSAEHTVLWFDAYPAGPRHDHDMLRLGTQGASLLRASRMQAKAGMGRPALLGLGPLFMHVQQPPPPPLDVRKGPPL